MSGLPMRHCWMFLIALGAGCSSSAVEGLQGRWNGQIICLGETSDLTLGLSIEGDLLAGSAQIRTKNSNIDFSVKGSQQEITRVVECKDYLCQGPQDCAGKLDREGAAGKSQCVENVCTPCYEQELMPQVTLILRDDNVQIPDPEVELLRYGNARMEGTIRKYCVDEKIAPPKVKLEKE